ncbi:MAG: hypothetical protein ACK41E_07125 [Deinococcales bacterium]
MTPLEIAQNPKTAPAELSRLGSSRDVAVRLAVAKNPNTPEATLRLLAALHPEALLENPVLLWLRFENPAWFNELPDFARLALLQAPNCPSVWLETAASADSTSQLAALQNSSISTEMLQSWTTDSEIRHQEAAALHIAHPSNQIALRQQTRSPQVVDYHLNGIFSNIPTRLELQTELFKDMLAAQVPLSAEVLGILALEFDPELRALVATRPDLPEALLEVLGFDEDDAVLLALKNTHTLPRFVQQAENLSLKHPKDLARLARGTDRAKTLAAQHGQISQNLLKKLARDEAWQVRQAVAANPKTPPVVLTKLATDLDRDVREAVAKNPSTPSKPLQVLLADSQEEVALAARQNPSTPPEVLQLLERLERKDPSLTQLEHLPAWLESRVAVHPNATAALLETLAKSEQSQVRIKVAANPNTPQRLLELLLEDPDPDVQVAMLQRPHLPEALLQRLAVHTDARVVEAVAKHPNLSKALLERLAQDANWVVRREIALHPRCPTHLLELLAQDSDSDVREACVRNPHANALVALYALGVELRLPEVLQQLEAHDPQLDAAWLEFIARRSNDLGKRFVASHPNLTENLMLWLATHDQWAVRRALAQNPNLPQSLFEVLATDSDRDVRAAIAAHPNAPKHILERLVADAENLVRFELIKRGFGLERLCWEDDDELLAQIPESYLQLRRRLEAGQTIDRAELEPFMDIPLVLRLLPKDIDFDLELALRHESWQVRQAAARNLHCTVQDLQLLATDSDRDVRLEVLRHPKVTTDIVSSLFRDPDILVRRAALAHPCLEPRLRQMAQRYILDECLRSSTLNRIVALAQTERVSELQKRKNWRSLEWRERLAVASNPHTPRAILEYLCQDANRLVRHAAALRLEGQS